MEPEIFTRLGKSTPRNRKEGNGRRNRSEREHRASKELSLLEWIDGLSCFCFCLPAEMMPLQRWSERRLAKKKFVNTSKRVCLWSLHVSTRFRSFHRLNFARFSLLKKGVWLGSLLSLMSEGTSSFFCSPSVHWAGKWDLWKWFAIIAFPTCLHSALPEFVSSDRICSGRSDWRGERFRSPRRFCMSLIAQFYRYVLLYTTDDGYDSGLDACLSTQTICSNDDIFFSWL